MVCPACGSGFARMINGFGMIFCTTKPVPNPNPNLILAFPSKLQQDGVLQLLDAIEPPVRLSPRDRLELGLTHGSVNRLHSAAIASLFDGDEALGIRCLLSLAELCREVECSEHLGAIGGHQSILLLMTDGQLPGVARCRKGNMAAAEAAAAAKQATSDREVIDIEVSCDSNASVDDNGEEEEDDVQDRDLLEEEGNEEDESDVQCAAALAAARIIASGCVFPMHASSKGQSSALGRFPLRYDFVVASNAGGGVEPPPLCSGVNAAPSHGVKAHASKGRGISTVDFSPLGEREREGKGGGDDDKLKEHISILVRPVKDRQHSQFDVGFQMWPAAVILSRYLCRSPGVVRGRRVLEVGAGLGLCGLVAAHFATAVTLSDFNPVVLRALEGNLALNSRCSINSSDHADNEEGMNSVNSRCTISDNAVEHESLADSRSTGSDTGVTGRGVGCGETEVDGYVGEKPGRGRGVAIAERGGVIVRHLDWDTLPAAHAPGAGALVSSSPGGENLDLAPKWRSATSRTDGGGVSIADSGNEEGEEGEGTQSIEHGERFDVIIASDHICQVRSCT